MTTQTLNKPVSGSALIGEVKASYAKNPLVPRVKITGSSSANSFIRKIYPVEINYREAIVAIFLDRSNTTVGYTTISIGGISQACCDPKILFQTALLSHASGIILVHNHPSGNLKPSKADCDLTTQLSKAGKVLDLPLIDHIILTESSYYSFADHGRL